MKKKMIALLLCAALILGAAGCGNNGTQATAESGGAASGTEGETDSETAGEAESETQTAGGEGAADKDAHINIAFLTDVSGMDPANGSSGWNLTRSAVGETLLTVNEDMELQPMLADEWEQIDDVTYRLHIRQGVKFSNGTEMTPELVKASIERSYDENPKGYLLNVASIAVDGENLIFTTNEPYSAFLYNLTEPMYCIIDTTDLAEVESRPVCTGPYLITEYIEGEKIELEINPEYWGDMPSIRSITVLSVSSDTKVAAIMAGDIDLAQGATNTTLSQLEGSDSIELASTQGTRENDIVFNCAQGNPLSDVRLRQALSYATNREAIALIAGNGYSKPLGTAFPESVGYHSDQVDGQIYDEERALELLAEAGYEDTDDNGYVEKDGEELVITISISSTSASAIYEALKDMWEAVGVHTEIEMLENLKEKRNSGNFDVISGGWQTVNAADGQYYLAARWGSDGADNYGKYSSEAFDEVLDELDLAFDKETRLDTFARAQQILADECPALWLYANDNITLINTDKLVNVSVHPIDYYLVTTEWKMAE